MLRKLLSKLSELALSHLQGRKFLAFLVTSSLIFASLLACGLIPSVQPVIVPLSGALLGSLGIFITGHTVTDVKSSSSLKTE